MDDNELLDRIQQGDHAAFNVLVKQHHLKFYNLAYRYMSNEEEAEDIVQIAFLKLWENPFIWKKDKGAKFTTWFYRIIINLCLDKQKKRRALPLGDDIVIEDKQSNQQVAIEQKEVWNMISDAITQLPDRQKTALILCVYEDKSHQEAADIMKINIQALRSLLMRAKAQLKKSMQDYT